MSSKTGQVTVSTTEDLRQALAAGYAGDQISIASDNEAAIAAARAEGETSGRTAAAEPAANAERERILGIQALARDGFDAELKAAIDNGSSPEAFAHSLMKAAQERGITLEAMRKGAPPAAAHGGKGDGGGETTPRISTKNIYGDRVKAMAGTSAR